MDHLGPSNPFEFLFLKNPEDLGLGLEAHVRYLVEEDGAFVRQVEFAALLLGRPGKGALFVTEKFALDEVFRNGGAVDLDERLAVAPAQPVQCPGHQLLARPVLAHDEDPRIGGGDDADGLL